MTSIMGAFQKQGQRVYDELERVANAAERKPGCAVPVVIRWANKVIPALEGRGYTVTQRCGSLYEVSGKVTG